MLIQFLMWGGVTAIGIGLGLAVVPVFLHTSLLGIQFGSSHKGLIYFGLFFVTIFISLLANTHRINGEAMAQMLGFASIILIGYLIAQQRDRELLERILKLYAVLISALLIVVILDGDRLWGRLMGRLHSNLWGSVALAAVPGALIMRNPLLRVALIAFLLYTIGWELNSRGPFLFATATVVAFTLFWAFHNPQKAVSSRTLIIASLGMIVAGIGLMMSWEVISNQLLLINSATRGLGSGFSGRFELWSFLLGVAAEHPFTGVGFRMHGEFVFARDLFSAHNAYLAILVDLGVPGLAIYLLILGTSVYKSIIVSRMTLVGTYLISYMLVGLTTGLALNVGNPASILFIFSLMYALSVQGRKANRSHHMARTGTSTATSQLSAT